MEKRSHDEEQPQYGPHDNLNNYFTFRVHHGMEFDGSMVNYTGGSTSYYDYVNLDELSMLDIEDIAIELGYSMAMGFWIQVPRYGQPFIIARDLDLLWFQDKIPDNRVVDLYMQPIHALQVVSTMELLPSQEGETSNVPYEGVSDGPTKAFVDGPDEDRNRTSKVNEECDEALIREFADRAGKRRNKGKQVAEEDISEEDITDDGEENDQLWDSDYDQEEEDIATKTCVDPTMDWDSLQIPDFGREECGSGSDIDCASDEVRSLDGTDCEEDEGTKPRKFIKTKYHEFNPGRDIGNPIFRIGMVFANADDFRNAIRAHAVKHRRSIKFKKNDKNRIRAVCNDERCKWFVFGSWLADGKTFKIKSLIDEHTCAMCFKNRSAAREMIQGSIKDQYSKLWEYGAKVRRMNPGSSVIMKCSSKPRDENPKFQRLYICLHALKKGWKEGCRPLIGLDGCFIKGYHTSQLLTAIGVDPNNQIYPIAYALVESECRDTWDWFIKLLSKDLKINNSHAIVWIDRFHCTYVSKF
ncbi:hypothetical protein Q3G72_031983 [Acer saccharum]|nr:hypothetical protein Q3G72_031983 [Acer saccharum]